MHIKKEQREDGFTLIELLVVILIIGILASIAIPVFLNQRKTANEAAVKSDLTNAAKVFETELVVNKGKSYPTIIPQSVKTSAGVTLSLPTGTPVDPIVNIPFVARDGYQTSIRFSQKGSSLYITAPATDIVRNTEINYKYQCLDSGGNTIDRSFSHGLNTKITDPIDKSLQLNCLAGTTLIKGSTIVFSSSSKIPANSTQLLGVVGEYALPDPNALVASNIGFCIDGTHENINGKKFKYDSSNGGLAEGKCT